MGAFTTEPLSHILDHVDRGLEVLPSQFDDSPNLRAFLGALLDGVQVLEDHAQLRLRDTSLDDAVGIGLDWWGVLLIEPRNDRTDAEYRARLRTKLQQLRSNGEPWRIARVGDELLEATRLELRLLDDEVVLSYARAAGVPDTALAAEVLADLLRMASAGSCVTVQVRPPGFFGWDGVDGALPWTEGTWIEAL